VQPAETQSSAASPVKLAHFKPVMQQHLLTDAATTWQKVGLCTLRAAL
jgi:hypothetical protein